MSLALLGKGGAVGLEHVLGGHPLLAGHRALPDVLLAHNLHHDRPVVKVVHLGDVEEDMEEEE